jgi:hypothetical protein
MTFSTRNNLDCGPVNGNGTSSDNLASVNAHHFWVQGLEQELGVNIPGPGYSPFDPQLLIAWPGTSPSTGLFDYPGNPIAEDSWYEQPDPLDMVTIMQHNVAYPPGPVDLDPAVPEGFIAQIPSAPLLAPLNQQAPSVSTGISAHSCTQLGCPAIFKRPYERSRHEATAHGINQTVHLCPVLGCPKSQGTGYSRADKVKEHLWKKHANLGYTKSR